MTYRAVFFDAGATLIDAALDRSQRLLHFAGLWGLRVEETEAREIHGRQWQQHFGAGFPEGTQASTDALFLNFYRDVLAGLRLADPGDAFATRLVTECDYTRWMRPYPDSAAALGRLRGRYRLGLLSNAPPSLRPLMEKLGLAGYFDTMTISGEVGVRKPEEGIYRIALAGLGAEPGESLFVDDLEENLVAAAALGMTCLRIDRRDVRPPTAFRRVTGMAGVLMALGEPELGEPALIDHD